MTDFCDLGGIQFRTGRTTDRPIVPPDKQAYFWDRELAQLWGVNDSMEWVLSSSAVSGVITSEVSFVYTDGPIATLMAIAEGVRLIRVQLYIDTPFDGTPTMQMGDVGDIDRLMDTESNVPSVASSYQVEPNYLYAADTDIVLQMDGGYTQGAGRVSFMYDVPESS